MLTVTPRPPRNGDDRNLTGGFSVDKRALYATELLPLDSAGEIRTHGLELMRLARTAAPLPRFVANDRSARLDSNQRSPVPETGGVADFPTSRCEYPRRESNPLLPVESRASSPVDHGGASFRRAAP